MSNSNFPIDVVITWVDGQDPEFLQKKQRYSDTSLFEANNKTRFNEVGELSYVVRSIFKYAPYIRTIFILTDDQTPAIIEESKTWNEHYRKKIKLVDHRDVFKGYLDVLPTFNINTIEVMLHRIEGLSEHFIYFNDDVFLIKPTKPEDWFRDGKPLIRGKWTPLPNKVWYKKFYYSINPAKLKKAGYKRGQALSAEIAGYTDKYFRTYHNPKPLRRSLIDAYFQNNPEIVQEQIKHRFRSPEQYNPHGLIWHHAFLTDSATTTGDLNLIEVPYKAKHAPNTVITKLKKAMSSPDILFINLQSLDLLPEADLKKVLHILDDITAIDLVTPK